MGAQRCDVVLDGERISYLRAGSGPLVLLLHGTFWSRVWQPVLPALAAAGFTAIAPDFPGFGASAGELTLQRASAPALAAWSWRLTEALGLPARAVCGHDIGGAVAQQMAAEGERSVRGLGLVNSVLYDSWPVPAVQRFRDPQVREQTSPDELVQARRASLAKAIARPLSETEQDEWLSPWRDGARARSWMAMAAAADPRYTLEVLGALRERKLPVALVWGQDDEFQPIAYAQRLAAELPRSTLTRIPGARHIPTEDAPKAVADALTQLLRDLDP